MPMSSKPPLHGFDTGRFLPGEPPAPPARQARGAQSAWQRWEMASFTEKTSPPPDRPAPAPEPELERMAPVVLIDEAELARLRLAAQNEGQAQGHALGYARGLAEGQAAGLAAVQTEAGQLQALALALPAALRLAQSQVADDLLALALDIARQVLGQALAAEPQAILAVVHELLQAEPALTGAPQLLLHPDDAALVKEHLADELKAAGWRLRPDTQITRGGCRVLAASGEKDASIESRWERVSAALARRTAPAAPAPCAPLEDDAP